MARARVMELRRVKGICVALPIALRVQRLLRQQASLPQLVNMLARGPVWPGVSDPVTLHQDVGRALRLLGVRKRGCVPQAMTLYAILSRQREAVSYVSGVRRLDGELDGHAWVELNGVPIAEGNLTGFTVLFRHDNRLYR